MFFIGIIIKVGLGEWVKRGKVRSSEPQGRWKDEEGNSRVGGRSSPRGMCW